MSSYSVSVTITSQGGASVHALQVTQGDDTPGNVAAAYGLADPLTITRKLSDDARLPLSHPEPDEAVVTIIAPNAATYSDVAIGDPVGIQVYPVRDLKGTPVEFYGRVAAIIGDPHDLGVRLTLTCVDYTADLAEIDVGGAAAYPVESAVTRLNRITDEALLPRFPITGGLSSPTTAIAARSAGWSDVYSLLREVLDSSPLAITRDENGTALAVTGVDKQVPSYRGCIVPVITGGLLDQTTPFVIRLGAPWTRRYLYAPPFRVTNVAGVYTVTVSPADSSPATGCPILAASRVEFAPSFAQSKSTQLPNVTQGTDAQGNRYVWDWRAQDRMVPGGGTPLGSTIVPYGPGLPAGGSGPPILQDLQTVVDVTEGGGFPSLSTVSNVGAFMVPFRPSTLTDWAIGTMSYQAWAEPTRVYSWTGAANASTSERRDQLGNVETNLHTDPTFGGAGTTMGFVANAGGTITKDATNPYQGAPSLKVVTTVDNWGYFTMDGASHLGTACPPAPAVGQVHTMRVVVKSDTAQTVWLRQYGTAGAANGAPVALVANTWTVLTVTWTPTAGTGPFLSVRRQDGTALLGNTWLALPMIVAASTISDSPGWAPGWAGSPNVQWLRPELTQLLTVAGAAVGKLPNNREWLSGLVTGTTLRVAKGRPILDLDVAPPSYDWKANREQLGSSLGVASMDSPAVTALTLAQLGPRDTFNDYTMVRGS